MNKEIVYIEFLNKKRNFQLDVIGFKGEDAILRMKQLDNLKVSFAEGAILLR